MMHDGCRGQSSPLSPSPPSHPPSPRTQRREGERESERTSASPPESCKRGEGTAVMHTILTNTNTIINITSASLTASPYPPLPDLSSPTSSFSFLESPARTSPVAQHLVSSPPRQHLGSVFLHSLLVRHSSDNSTSREGLSTLLEQRQDGRSTAEAAAVALNFHTKLATVMKGLDYPHEPNKEPPDRHEPFKTGWL